LQNNEEALTEVAGTARPRGLMWCDHHQQQMLNHVNGQQQSGKCVEREQSAQNNSYQSRRRKPRAGEKPKSIWGTSM